MPRAQDDFAFAAHHQIDRPQAEISLEPVVTVERSATRRIMDGEAYEHLAEAVEALRRQRRQARFGDCSRRVVAVQRGGLEKHGNAVA